MYNNSEKPESLIKKPVSKTTIIQREWIATIILIAFGGLTVGFGLNYPVGEIGSIGPGFFPLLLGFFLIFLGAMNSILELSGTVKLAKEITIDLRSVTLISLGIVMFIILGRWGGLIPASFSVVFLSSLADRKNTIVTAAILAIAMTIFAAVVFYWILEIQFPLFTWGQ